MKPDTLLWFSLLLTLFLTLLPTNGSVAGNYLDKLVHFLLFAFLAFRVEHKFHQHQLRIFWLLSCVLLGFLTEFLQQFIPGRNMDFYDALADTLGVCAAHLFFLKRL